MAADDDWRDPDWPDPAPRIASGRVRYRAATTLLLSLALVAWFHDYLLALAPRLWPPSDPLSRWVTLLLLQLLGFVMLPMVVGVPLADRLYDRRHGD
jgi:hypothetical protein